MDSSDQKNQTHSSSALKVLLVGDDLQVLKILEDNLKKCGYYVITCNSAQEATDLIMEKKHGVDLVLCGLEFEHLKYNVRLKVPLFVMCKEDTSAMMKVLKEHARSCILKSSLLNLLRELYQVVRIKETTQTMIDLNETEPPRRRDDEDVIRASSGGKKLKENVEEETNSDAVNNNVHDPNKKQKRFSWYGEPHEKFVEEVNKIGLDKATANKVLKAMNVPGLTRGQVSSHLQKYRKKLERESNVPKELADHSGIQGPAVMMMPTRNDADPFKESGDDDSSALDLNKFPPSDDDDDDVDFSL